MDATTRATLEIVYRILLSAVVEIARALGKPSPVVTRAGRRGTLHINDSGEG